MAQISYIYPGENKSYNLEIKGEYHKDKTDENLVLLTDNSDNQKINTVFSEKNSREFFDIDKAKTNNILKIYNTSTTVEANNYNSINGNDIEVKITGTDVKYNNKNLPYENSFLLQKNNEYITYKNTTVRLANVIGENKEIDVRIVDYPQIGYKFRDITTINQSNIITTILSMYPYTNNVDFDDEDINYNVNDYPWFFENIINKFGLNVSLKINNNNVVFNNINYIISNNTIIGEISTLRPKLNKNFPVLNYNIKLYNEHTKTGYIATINTNKKPINDYGYSPCSDYIYYKSNSTTKQYHVYNYRYKYENISGETGTTHKFGLNGFERFNKFSLYLNNNITLEDSVQISPYIKNEKVDIISETKGVQLDYDNYTEIINNYVNNLSDFVIHDNYTNPYPNSGLNKIQRRYISGEILDGTIVKPDHFKAISDLISVFDILDNGIGGGSTDGSGSGSGTPTLATYDIYYNDIPTIYSIPVAENPILYNIDFQPYYNNKELNIYNESLNVDTTISVIKKEGQTLSDDVNTFISDLKNDTGIKNDISNYKYIGHRYLKDSSPVIISNYECYYLDSKWEIIENPSNFKKIEALCPSYHIFEESTPNTSNSQDQGGLNFHSFKEYVYIDNLQIKYHILSKDNKNYYNYNINGDIGKNIGTYIKVRNTIKQNINNNGTVETIPLTRDCIIPIYPYKSTADKSLYKHLWVYYGEEYFNSTNEMTVDIATHYGLTSPSDYKINGLYGINYERDYKIGGPLSIYNNDSIIISPSVITSGYTGDYDLFIALPITSITYSANMQTIKTDYSVKVYYGNNNTPIIKIDNNYHNYWYNDFIILNINKYKITGDLNNINYNTSIVENNDRADDILYENIYNHLKKNFTANEGEGDLNGTIAKTYYRLGYLKLRISKDIKYIKIQRTSNNNFDVILNY